MKINRRSVLKGLSLGAGGVLLSPLLQQIQTQAAGVTKPPQRFVFVLEGNGLNWPQITPTAINRGKEKDRTELVDVSLTDMELPLALQPIKPFQDRLTILNGLSGKIAGGGHSNDFGALGCYKCGGGVGNSGAPAGETIDVALGKKLGGVFTHVGLGMTGKPEENVIYNCSAWAKGKPMPTTCQPAAAYANLFGSVAGGDAKAEFTAKTNVLDFLLDDVRKLHSQVAGSERDKLNAHLEAYEAMRDRQSRLNEIENTLRGKAPVVSDKYTSSVETDRLDAQFDIGTAALIGGLTSALTISSGAGNPYFGVKFTGLGIDFGKHGIGHGGSYNGMTWDEMAIKIRGFHFELIARMMRKLDAVPEGDGTMLDNTTIVYLSDAAEGHHSRCWEWPFVLFPAKNCGMKCGRYIEYPYWGHDGHREIGNLYTTFLHVVGEHRDYFGIHDPMLKGKAAGDGPLEALLV
jgi:hypothetical protein